MEVVYLKNIYFERAMTDFIVSVAIFQGDAVAANFAIKTKKLSQEEHGEFQKVIVYFCY